ncbi:MAG: hypothetical protein J07HQW1_00871 [Haloquadratum walsbyi J07HQW1]|uniref:Uncharacterized protein n=1 Tax=Haloquadratum walsbyi J07HQW1 TaxID=1238424 RepID=U1N393_9EURY|nr:MAG: hypothetical protein J07HQW1_00871 [Haloquadratum walsbyi J07HQW1]
MLIYPLRSVLLCFEYRHGTVPTTDTGTTTPCMSSGFCGDEKISDIRLYGPQCSLGSNQNQYLLNSIDEGELTKDCNPPIRKRLKLLDFPTGDIIASLVI